MKRNFNQKKGITLIALVVTIIVLLLLAGVSISMLTGQNGILTRAADAKTKTDDAEVQENERMQGYEDVINQYAGNSNQDNLPASAVGQARGTQIKSPAEYSSNVKAIADGNGNYFPLPEGAEYKGEGGVNKVIQDNYYIANKNNVGVVVYIKESEFVWVPVENPVFEESKKSQMPTNDTKSKTYTPMAVYVNGNYKGILYQKYENSYYLMVPDENSNYLSNLAKTI